MDFATHSGSERRVPRRSLLIGSLASIGAAGCTSATQWREGPAFGAPHATFVGRDGRSYAIAFQSIGIIRQIDGVGSQMAFLLREDSGQWATLERCKTGDGRPFRDAIPHERLGAVFAVGTFQSVRPFERPRSVTLIEAGRRERRLRFSSDALRLAEGSDGTFHLLSLAGDTVVYMTLDENLATRASVSLDLPAREPGAFVPSVRRLGYHDGRPAFEIRRGVLGGSNHRTLIEGVPGAPLEISHIADARSRPGA